MQAQMLPITNLLKFNDDLIEQGVASLSQEDASKPIDPNVNPILWMAGHLADSRAHMLELAGGEKRELPWGEAFKNPFDPKKDYPSVKQVADTWKALSAELLPRLSELSKLDLEKEINYDLPHGDKSKGGAFTFWLYHEAWHLGQVSVCRKAQGKSGLVPY